MKNGVSEGLINDAKQFVHTYSVCSDETGFAAGLIRQLLWNLNETGPCYCWQCQERDLKNGQHLSEPRLWSENLAAEELIRKLEQERDLKDDP